MKLTIKADTTRLIDLPGVRKWKEPLSDTHYKVIEKGEGFYILQWGNDPACKWVPATGDKSYGIVIDGLEYEFAGNIPVPEKVKKNGPKTWIEQTEELAPALAKKSFVFVPPAPTLEKLTAKPGKHRISSVARKTVNKADKSVAQEWFNNQRQAGKRVFYQPNGKAIQMFASSRREVVEREIGSVESLTLQQFKKIFG
jgi:hypothetical protein